MQTAGISGHSPNHSDPASGYLSGLSGFAAKGFESPWKTIEAILEAVVEQLGMRTSFLSHIEREGGRFRVLASHNRPGGWGMEPGDAVGLSDSF